MTIISREIIAAEVMRQTVIQPASASDEAVIQAAADALGIDFSLVDEVIDREGRSQ